MEPDEPLEPDEPHTKDELMDRIRAGRADFDTMLLAVPPESVNEPVFAGDWSVKDLVAHIAAYEQWTADQIAAAREGRRATDQELYGVEDLPEDPEGWDLDRQNAAIRERYAALSYPDALAFAEQSFNRLLSALTELPDDDVVRPGVQLWTEGQAVIDVVPGQTYRHYLQHLPPLRELAGMTTIGGGGMTGAASAGAAGWAAPIPFHTPRRAGGLIHDRVDRGDGSVRRGGGQSPAMTRTWERCPSSTTWGIHPTNNPAATVTPRHRDKTDGHPDRDGPGHRPAVGREPASPRTPGHGHSRPPDHRPGSRDGPS